MGPVDGHGHAVVLHGSVVVPRFEGDVTTVHAHVCSWQRIRRPRILVHRPGHLQTCVGHREVTLLNAYQGEVPQDDGRIEAPGGAGPLVDLPRGLVSFRRRRQVALRAVGGAHLLQDVCALRAVLRSARFADGPGSVVMLQCLVAVAALVVGDAHLDVQGDHFGVPQQVPILVDLHGAVVQLEGLHELALEGLQDAHAAQTLSTMAGLCGMHLLQHGPSLRELLRGLLEVARLSEHDAHAPDRTYGLFASAKANRLQYVQSPLEALK
mmetsp:Transcript_44823/g.126879  ORF Transcript_44823/g.126879 Transcript_44823/m.126879 type:complete len:267 (+) Transcript_44823:1795-2595(+)